MVHSVLRTVCSVMYVQHVNCLFNYQDWQNLKKTESKEKQKTQNSKLYIKNKKLKTKI